jgi:UDP-glucose 4-epimerase
MRILFTGSAGHLGEALMRTLPLPHCEAVGLDIKSSPFRQRVGSITDRGLAPDAAKRIAKFFAKPQRPA